MRLELRFSSVTVLGLAAIAGAFAACSREPAPAGAVAEPASSVATAATSAPPAASKGCTAGPEKVWGEAASVSVGITRVELDSGRVAFGVVLGGRPEVMVFDAKGEGSAVHVSLEKSLTAALPKDKGRREILRVTPGLGSGSEVMAFVDRREVTDGRRLVACGPSDSAQALLQFDGRPLLAVDEDRLDASTGEHPKPAGSADRPAQVAPAGVASADTAGRAAPSGAGSAAPPPKGSPPVTPAANPEPPKAAAGPAAPRGGHRPPALHDIDPARIAAMRKSREAAAARAAAAKTAAPAAAEPSAAPAGSASAPPKEAAKDSSRPKGDKVRELRDCRTFVDRGGAHAWTVGSELVGQPRDDGSTAWSMELFAEQEHGRGKVVLTQSSLGKAPTKLPVYEAATALDLGGGAFVLAARYRGGLFAWLLDAGKHVRGPARAYPGATSWAPGLSVLGPDAALLVVQHDDARRVGRFAEFPLGAEELPSGLVDFDVGEPSLLGTPVSAVAGAERFLAVVSDDAARRLTLVPVNGAFARAGESLSIDTGVHDSEIVALADGRLLLVYLRGGASGRMSLVSRPVQCG